MAGSQYKMRRLVGDWGWFGVIGVWAPLAEACLGQKKGADMWADTARFPRADIADE